MCGIIGYIGKPIQLKEGISCLERLEYRGYDSAGIAYFEQRDLSIVRSKGKIENLKKKVNLDLESSMMIAHTRWATHGEPSEINSHPHQTGSITLVHNGIIENTKELKENYLKDIVLQSETDTEIAGAFLNLLYQREQSFLKAARVFFEKVKGSYAIVCAIKEEPDTLYAIKKDSPLLIGITEEGIYLASDIPAILSKTRKYILVEDFECVKVKDAHAEIFDRDQNLVTHDVKVYEEDDFSATKERYAHFMLKEIYEQPKYLQSIFQRYIQGEELLPEVYHYEHIEIVACGSAYHAGLMGKVYIESLLKIPVTVELASEFRYKEMFLNKKTLVIFISQSGETADTLAATKIVKESSAHTLGIINVVGSSIAREVQEIIYTRVGSEIAVATTKAYSAQVAILLCLAYQNAKRKNDTEIDMQLEEEMVNIEKKLIEVLNRKEEIENLAKQISMKNDMYFLGRQEDECLARESSLKMKEISYIHSESYAAGELKHGTISLIEKDTPVIGILTNEKVYEKTISNLVETASRGADVIVFSCFETPFSKVFKIAKGHPYLSTFSVILATQLLSYKVAILRGCHVDQPKNLAKSVTVE